MGSTGGKERCAYTEMKTEKQSTRLEHEVQEADPGKGEGSVRQSWELQQAVWLWLGLGIDTRVSNETLHGCRKHGICTEGIAAQYSGKLKT